MRFGYFNIFGRSPGESATEAVDRSMAETVYAESLGYDDVWLAEAYLLGTVVFGAGTLTQAAMVAGRTSRIRIGTAVCTMPLHHPLAAVVEAASIDQFSHGRLDLGIGRGLSAALGPGGFDALGSGELPEPSSDGYRQYYLESIDCVKGLLEEESFSYKGDYFTFKDTKVFPRSYQEPHLPVWVVAQSPQTFIEMGKRGIHLLIPIPGYHFGVETWDETKEHLSGYRRAWKDAGHPGTPKVAIRIPTFIHDTTEKAWDVAARAFEGVRTRFQQLAAESGLSSVFANAPERATKIFGDVGVDRIFSSEVPIDETIETISIAGTPEFAVDEFTRIREEFDAHAVMIEPQFLGQTLREDHLRTLRLVADKVMPHFK